MQVETIMIATSNASALRKLPFMVTVLLTFDGRPAYCASSMMTRTRQ